MKKTTIEEFIERATKVHNGFYDYSKSIYINAHTKLMLICPVHGGFMQIADSHLVGNGCPKCGRIRTQTARAIPQQEFIKIATKIHNGFYNYSKVVYKNTDKRITIICPEHGEFTQTPYKHLIGRGCSQCGGSYAKFTTEEFIKRAMQKHNGFYDYSKSFYTSSIKKLIIICPKHGEFHQTPGHHLNGRGCFKCAGKNKTTEEFIQESNNKHNGVYDYSKSIYKGVLKKVIIICSKHGEFLQTAGHHLMGVGCSKCVHRISKPETRWLDYLFVPKEFRQKFIIINGQRFYPDALDIENKIVWEFYGDFWHGNLQIFNPSEINKVTKCTFGELNLKTMNKEKVLKDNGYNVISIWESDFKSQSRIG